MKKFGTFGGVFTPSILTILGVIMYLRLGWVIGNAGTLVIVLGIILMSHIVSVSTGLSISSIATDKKIKTGGIYYILSRSLGLPIGGAIGLTLYAATALSISLYLIGFSESVLLVLKDTLHIEVITTNHLRIAGSIALVAIVTIAFISTSFAIKTQYLILGTIAISLVSVFLGTSEGKGFDFSPADLGSAPGFAVLFGVFFPAVTGFTAGVAMSGDLKDPKKSIPLGTMMAISVGFLIYTSLAVFIFYSIPGAELQKNNNALVEFSWIPQLVIAGIWGATLSSALGGILGGPRILQSMSLDKITPGIFGKGTGAGKEPRNALLLTFVLAEAGILIGELNVIAGIVAMFYMAAYLVINLSCFLEKWASPDFRPKFKINLFIPLIGVVTIFLLMMQLNLIATLAAVVIMGLIFIFLSRRQLELSSGDVWSSVWSSIVKLGLKNLDQKPKNRRNWEPNILLFSGEPEARPHLLSFSKAVAGRGGMISNFDLIETPTAKTLFPKYEQAHMADEAKDDIIFHRKQECQNLYKGIEAIASTYGFSGIEPNTILMGWARNTKDPIWFAQMNQKLNELDYNILYLDYDKKKGFGSYAKIDIWWNNNITVGDLTLQIAKRILLSGDWSNAVIRIFYLNDQHQKNIIENLIRKQLASLRIDFPFQVINNEIEKKSFYEVIQQHSSDTDLIMLEIPGMSEGEEASFVRETNKFLGVMGTTMLVRASESFTAKTQDLLNLEDSYQNHHTYLKPESRPTEELKRSGNSTLDEPVVWLDEEISKINADTAGRIFASLSGVYHSLYTLLENQLQDNPNLTAASLLESKQELIEDLIQNKRFDPVSAVINQALANHMRSVQEVVAKTPRVIRRIFTDNEIIVKENDSPEISLFKQKTGRRRKRKIHLLNTAEDFYKNEYSGNLSQQILFIGVSANSVNDCFIRWTQELSESQPVNLKSLVQNIEETLFSLNQHFLTYLNDASRQYCNLILIASNHLDPAGPALRTSRKINRNKRTAALKTIRNYAQTWLLNQVWLTSNLQLTVQLVSLRIKTSECIRGTSGEIEKSLLDHTLHLLEKSGSTLRKITPDGINGFEKELYQISNQINAESSLSLIQSELDINILPVKDQIEIVPPEVINVFESIQDGILPVTLNARKIAKGLIENEIVAPLTDLFQQIINDGRAVHTRLENSMELLRFTLLDTTGNKKNAEEVLQKALNQFDESADSIRKLKLNQDLGVQELLLLLKKLLQEDTIAKRADDFDLVLRKPGSRRLSAFLKNHTENLFNKLDSLILYTRDKIAKSDFEFQSKAVQNPHTKFADFSDKVSLSSTREKQLPFYYNQLFTGKHAAPAEPLKNRAMELSEVEKAVNRFSSGKTGAILFTGDHLSGKTYLMQNAVNLYCPKNIIRVTAPVGSGLKGAETVDSAFSIATGLEGDSSAILKQIRKKSTIVFEDLELWWTRSPSGSESLREIVRLIKLYGSKHLFVLDCNILFYQHIRQYLNIDDHLLATIATSSLNVSEISEAILKRHRSGGMKFIWQNKAEDKLNKRQVNNLFRKITSQTDGNIGMAFCLWLGNIREIKKTEIYLSNFEKLHLPIISNPEWENMLIQLLMHKQLTLARLKEIYYTEPEDYVHNNLQSLIRAGLVIRTPSKSYCVSPFTLTYLTKYLKKKQSYDAV